jgi:2-aminoadipate transaminase
MRLNFSGVTEDEIREGIRRLGEVVREQVALYSTLSGEVSPRPAAASKRTSAAPASQAETSAAPPHAAPPGQRDNTNVLPLTRKRAG